MTAIEMESCKAVRVLVGCMVVSHDGERQYRAGEKLSLVPSEADELVLHGFAEPAHE